MAVLGPGGVWTPLIAADKTWLDQIVAMARQMGNEFPVDPS